MAREPHHPVSAIADSQAEAVPDGGGAGVVGGGGSVRPTPSFGTSLAVPLVDPSVETCEEADGAVGAPPHHVDARAHPTSNASPDFRGELGRISLG